MILRSYSDKSQAMFTLYWILKQSVAETVPDKDSVHTRNAAFGTISDPEQDYFAPFLKIQYLQRNGALVPVHTVPDHFLRHSVSLPGTV